MFSLPYGSATNGYYTRFFGCARVGVLRFRGDPQGLHEVRHAVETIDGARLGYALTASGNDVTIEDIASRRRVLYRRHQGGARCPARPWCSRTATCRSISDDRQAAWRAAGQGMAGTAVRHVVHRRLKSARPPRQRCRGPYPQGAGGTWLHADFRCADQPGIFVTLDNETSERLQRDVRLGFTEKADDTHTKDAHLHQLGHDRRAGGRAGRTAVKDSPQNKESREIDPGFSLMYNDCIAIAAGAIQRRLSASASRSIATNLRTDDSTE